MGAHFDLTNNLAGDTTHFRTLQGFKTAPINLALFPPEAGLEMSFFQIARLIDDNNVGGGPNAGQCSDCGDVQFRLDDNPDKEIDDWGFWQKLVPFQNVYDHRVLAWSAFGGYYCLFTPTDTGTAPPNPKGVTETICFPQGAWSHCGTPFGTSPETTVNCTGPGVVDIADGVGVWVETKFNLAGLVGQRVEVRWIAESWNFGGSSYFEVGSGWNGTTGDDGWWLDDICLTGAITEQVTPEPDDTPRTQAICPTTSTDRCDETVGDGGTTVVLKSVDPVTGDEIGGVTTVATAGESVRITAINSTLPGGCVDGVAEYQFFKNGVLVQDFGPKSFFLDSPLANAQYIAKARCSTDFSCESVVGDTLDLAVYSGDGADSFFGARASPPDTSIGVVHDLATNSTTLNWWAPGSVDSDLYKGTLGTGFSKGSLALPDFYLVDAANCFLSNVSGVEAPGGQGFNYTSGALDQTADPNPAIGFASFYLASRNAPGGGSVNALGCASPGLCSNQDGAGPNQDSCSRDRDCSPPGVCLNVAETTLPSPLGAPNGCPEPQDPDRLIRRVTGGNLCP